MTCWIRLTPVATAGRGRLDVTRTEHTSASNAAATALRRTFAALPAFTKTRLIDPRIADRKHQRDSALVRDRRSPPVRYGQSMRRRWWDDTGSGYCPAVISGLETPLGHTPCQPSHRTKPRTSCAFVQTRPTSLRVQAYGKSPAIAWEVAPAIRPMAQS